MGEGITRRAIVEASIQILNRDGADNLTMRTIAKELNIKAASLYNHIQSKQDLFGEIAEYMCSYCGTPEAEISARQFTLQTCRDYRAMLLTVRDSAVVFENSIPNTPCRTAIIRGLTDRLLAMGVKEENLMTFSNLLNNYVLSFTADELRLKSRTPEELNRFEKMLSPRQNVIFMTGKDFDEQFEYGLDIILTGMEAVENARRTARRTP